MQSLPPKDDHLRQPAKTVFDPQTGFVVVQLNKAEFSYNETPVRYQGRVFSPKAELHITVISADAAEAVRSFIERQPDDAVHVQEIVDETRWVFRELDSFYHVVESPEVETIIQMVDMPYMAEFFSRLSGLIRQGFILPPTHVTLYMRGTEKGIGLPTQTVFDQLVQSPIRPEELQPAQGGSAASTRMP